MEELSTDKARAVTGSVRKTGATTEVQRASPAHMNALADAAFLSAAEGPPPYGSTAYTDAELQAMGAAGGLAGPLQGGLMGPPLAMPGRSMVPQHLPGPGRHLQIMDHTVHRIDTNIKANGEEEKEMVVSNLRHFTLKIGVIDRSGGGRETELPLKAELLYENGQLVEQLATCEPLLVGKTQVVAMQGMALFKLRITSLSSHRDKQRFRIRVSPVDTSLLLREPHLTAVTTPMKCVTKLSHRGSSGNKEGEGEEVRARPSDPAHVHRSTRPRTRRRLATCGTAAPPCKNCEAPWAALPRKLRACLDAACSHPRSRRTAATTATATTATRRARSASATTSSPCWRRRGTSCRSCTR